MARKKHSRPCIQPLPTTATHSQPPVENPSGAAVLNEKQVAEYLNVSVACVRPWRLFRKGPRFLNMDSLAPGTPFSRNTFTILIS